ncbi:MAG: hypothetical protein MUO82_01030 [Candidatus Thermoplasmatota archaeon]|nr:hypothetical protein [Candidatus Thermoplasmatota archaeon]
MQDEITGRYLQENQVLIVRKPDFGYSSMSPMLAGNIGSIGGINEKAIGVSEATCLTQDTTLYGIPASIRMGMVLDSVDNIESALQILNSNRTCGWNLFISDGKVPKGLILEQTANCSHICTWDESYEDNSPFWKISYVLRRTNCYVSPECAALQRENYNSKSLSDIVNFLLKKDSFFAEWTHYKALSEEIDQLWGNLDLNNSITLLRDVYNGKTDIIFRYMRERLHRKEPIHQWVATPKTGEMIVCFATKDKTGLEASTHYANLFDLTNSHNKIK